MTCLSACQWVLQWAGKSPFFGSFAIMLESMALLHKHSPHRTVIAVPSRLRSRSIVSAALLDTSIIIGALLLLLLQTLANIAPSQCWLRWREHLSTSQWASSNCTALCRSGRMSSEGLIALLTITQCQWQSYSPVVLQLTSACHLLDRLALLTLTLWLPSSPVQMMSKRITLLSCLPLPFLCQQLTFYLAERIRAEEIIFRIALTTATAVSWVVNENKNKALWSTSAKLMIDKD